MLTSDKAFPGIKHYGPPRAYLLPGNNGNQCVIKSFPEYHASDSGIRHLATQELLRAALEDTEGYRAARVFGHIALSKSNGAGYAIMEYVDAPTYRQAEGPINHTSIFTKTITKAIVHVQHGKKRKEMLPPGTNLSKYYDLLTGVRSACDEALSSFGAPIPQTIQHGRYAGCTNWDFNSENLLCALNDKGAPELVIIDQSADLSWLTSATSHAD
jgi:hypothetical protein